jgi:hypothetical protein
MDSCTRNTLAVVAAVTLAGCGIPTQTTRLTDGLQPVTVRLEPAVPTAGEPAELTIESPAADSIVFESENGLDRYWSAGPVLHAELTADFGDSLPVSRSEHYHEIPIRLPEANHRTVALTAGYNTVFARRSLVGSHSTVLFREVLSSGIWSAQGEWADHGWSARLEGFAGQGERGASLDVSRVLKRNGELSYGVAFHLDADRSEWLPESESPVLANRTAWRAGIGPSLMLRGVTASSQLGIYSDGAQTLQVVSTRIRINGNFTEVRLPVSLTAEKTFAFGGGAIVSRRRDALERLVASVHLVDALALNLGVATHRSAWPNDEPGSDFRANETLFTLGGQYSVTW